MVARLPRRLRWVIEVRYELGGQSWQTLAETGQELGLSRERVRQLQEEALVRLRHPAHSQELRALLRRHSQHEYEWAEADLSWVGVFGHIFCPFIYGYF
jgi:hypothetical protein